MEEKNIFEEYKTASKGIKRVKIDEEKLTKWDFGHAFPTLRRQLCKLSWVGVAIGFAVGLIEVGMVVIFLHF